MTRDEVAELFNDSLGRCNLDPNFFQRFYERFFACDAAVPALFAATDMAGQISMLRASLNMIMMSSLYPEAPRQFLDHTVMTHSKRKIPLHLYDAWLQCLMATVAETDPNYNEVVKAAWLTTLHSGIDYMKTHSVAT